MYTGICLYLNFAAIRYTNRRKPKGQGSQSLAKPDVTYTTKTNDKHIYNINKDNELWNKLICFGETLGYFEKKEPPT